MSQDEAWRRERDEREVVSRLGPLLTVLSALPLHVHVYHHFPEGGPSSGWGEVLAAIKQLGATMSAAQDALQAKIDDLKGDLTRIKDTVDSTKVLVAGLRQQLADAIQAAKDAGATPEQLQALTDLHTALGTEADDLAAANAAGTVESPPAAWPADQPPVDQPPPPADTPPVDTAPPADQPPADAPPATDAAPPASGVGETPPVNPAP